MFWERCFGCVLRVGERRVFWGGGREGVFFLGCFGEGVFWRCFGEVFFLGEVFLGVFFLGVREVFWEVFSGVQGVSGFMCFGFRVQVFRVQCLGRVQEREGNLDKTVFE